MEFEQQIENSTVKDLKINYKKDYRENYKWVRDENIYGLSVCKTFLQKNIRTNEMYLCIQESFYDHQSSKIVNMLEALQLVNENPFFNQFKAFCYEEIQQKSVRLYILMEYYDMNLVKIAKKRALIEKPLIDSLTKCFIKTISFLQKIESSLLAVNFSNVFIKSMNTSGTEGYSVKILHFPFMQSSFDMVLGGKEKHYNCYLSVEELECLEKKIEDNSELDSCSANLFTYGALLLDLLNSSNPNAQGNSSIYSKDSFRIDETNFFERINFVAEKYPKKVFLLLEQLLKFSDRQTPRAIFKMYENQQQINNSQISDDSIAHAKERIQMQLYSEFPIKNEVVSSPSNYNFSTKYNQAANNNNSNNSSSQNPYTSSTNFNNSAQNPYPNTTNNTYQNVTNPSSNMNDYGDKNQKYLHSSNTQKDYYMNSSNGISNPLGSSSQFESDANRNYKGRTKWDIPSIHNSGSRNANPLVTPFQNNQMSPTNRNDYNTNKYIDDSPTFATNNNISPSYQLSSESGKKNNIDSLINQKVNDNGYNQFLFESVEKDDQQQNNKRFIIQGRGENNQFAYKNQQPDASKPLISSEYFKPFNSQSNQTPLDLNLLHQNNNDKYSSNFPSIQIQKVESNYSPASASPPPQPQQINFPTSTKNENLSNLNAPPPPPPNLNQILNQKPPIPPSSGINQPQTSQNTFKTTPLSQGPPPPPPINSLLNPTNKSTIPPPPPPPFNILSGNTSNIPPAPPLGGIPPAPPLNGIPPSPSFNGIPPPPPLNGIPPAPSFNGIPPPPPMSILQQQNNKNDLQNQKHLIQSSLEVKEESTEEEQKRKKEEVLQRLFQNNNQAAPVRLPFFLPKAPAQSEENKNISDDNPQKRKVEIIQEQQKQIVIPPLPAGGIPPPPPNLIIDTNYIVKPKLEADSTVRDEQKERIDNSVKIQNQLKKESNDILSQSKSMLESSQRLIDKVNKNKLPENQTYSTTILEEDEDQSKKTDTLDKFRELKAQQNEYLENKQQRHMKNQQQIQEDKENTMRMIQSQHQLLLSSSSKKNLQSQENLNHSRKEDSLSYKNNPYPNNNNNKQMEGSQYHNNNNTTSNLYASFNPDSQEKPQNHHSFNENSIAVFDNENSNQNYKKWDNNDDSNQQNEMKSSFGQPNNSSYKSPQKTNRLNTPEKDLESYRKDDNQSSWRLRQTPPKNQEGFGFDNGITHYQMNNSSMSSNHDFRNSQMEQSGYKFPTNVIQVINSIGGSLNQSSDQSSSIMQEAIRYNQQQYEEQQPYSPNLNNSYQKQQSYLSDAKQDNKFDNYTVPTDYTNQKNQATTLSPNNTSYDTTNNTNTPYSNTNNSPYSNNATNYFPSNNNTNANATYYQNNQNINLNNSNNNNFNVSNSSYSPTYQKNSLYQRDFIPEQSNESELEEENSLIYKSPIQKNVKDYMNQLQKNKQFYEELRKQRPQGSKQFDPQEFDQIVQNSRQETDRRSQTNSKMLRSSMDSVNNNYKPPLEKIVNNENFAQPRPHEDNQESQYYNQEKTYDEQIYEDNQHLFFSEFKDFQDKDALIAQFYQQLKKFPDVTKTQYKNKSFYEGQVLLTDRNLIRNGFGILKMQNGDIYCGYFKNNQFDGDGVYFYNHGDIYRGQLRTNLKQGHGTYYYHEQGCIYSGEWNGNVKEGYGRLLLKNKEKYEGYFKQNVKCGRGVYFFANGDTFDGEWVYDKKCGFGTLEFQDGSHFQGNFYEDLPYGQGQMKFTNGDQYSGNYEEGIIAGFGIYIHANQQYYEGDFSKNQMNGEGLYYFKNGDKYQGQYVNGQREGYGKYFYQNGCIFEGQWIDNQKHGEGKYIFPDNTYYQGSFENSMKQGIGKQTFKENEFYNGCWKNDKRNGKGFYQFKDGSYYEGDWLNDKMHGEGTYQLKTKNGFKKIYGIWNDDELYQSFE